MARAPGRNDGFGADLDWVLHRAFGVGTLPAGGAGDRGFELGRRLALLPRIVLRTPFATLRAELGAEQARAAAAEQAAAEARGRQILDLAALVGEIRPVVALKFAALAVAGVLDPGGRHASDLDVLVAEADAEALAAALEAAGFRRSSIPGFEHHGSPLVHPRRGMVEIHTAIPGVRVGERFARLADLDAAALLGPTPLGGVRVPLPPVLAAHALVHGFVQHADAPWAYPPLQSVADLVDLGAAALAASRPLTRRDLPSRARAAAEDLVAAFAAGVLPRRRPAAALLARLLAGALAEGGRRVPGLSLRRPLSERTWALAHAARLRRALFPSAAELRVLYGPASGLGAARQRALRPVDVAWRALRALAGRGSRGKR